MTKKAETLEARIEQVIREHLAAQRQAATAALTRAFARLELKSLEVPRRRAECRRRRSSELEALAQALLEAVHASPGERMTVLATRVSAEPRSLLRPMAQLKASGRIRSVGERQFTRYFPMVAPKT